MITTNENRAYLGYLEEVMRISCQRIIERHPNEKDREDVEKILDGITLMRHYTAKAVS